MNQEGKLIANALKPTGYAVTCNPKTFVYDANLLIDAGYTLKRITLIDQFVYTKHQELIALFIHQSYENKGE